MKSCDAGLVEEKICRETLEECLFSYAGFALAAALSGTGTDVLFEHPPRSFLPCASRCLPLMAAVWFAEPDFESGRLTGGARLVLGGVRGWSCAIASHEDPARTMSGSV